MGFIRRGRFHLLFSAGIPLGKRKLGVDVPETFEHLEVGTPQKEQPRDPGCVAVRTCRRFGASLDATVSIQCVPSVRPPFTICKPALLRSIEPGVNFSLELTGDRAAALTTRYPTYNEDSQLDFAFKKYTKRHYKSWAKFAREKGYGEKLRLVLVSGFDMTKDFAMVAYSDNRTSVQAGATVSTPMFGSAAATAWGTWHTACSPHFKHGPQECSPPSREDLLSLQSGAAESLTTEFNQCVFIRYYIMHFKLWFLREAIRAGAGPHDLGSGENRGGTFPELSVQSNAEPVSDDEDPGGQLDPTTNNTDSEPDTVIRNVPDVRRFPFPFVSALIVALRIKNVTAGIPSRTTYSR